MSELPDPVEADRALKAKHRAMWAQGDYPAVAAEIIPELGPILVEACGLRGGGGQVASGAAGRPVRLLDVAAGSGNAAIPAALAGASVVASDLTPELFEAGRRLAADRGVEVEWRQADAEALPFQDDEFDTVLSCVGVMFAPHHQAAADELVRVCRPGGTIGLLSWTPEGFLGQMLATMSRICRPRRPVRSPRPCGGTRRMSAPCSGTGSRTSRHASRRSSSTVSRAPRSSATTSRHATAPPSRPTGPWPTTPTARPGWTGISPNSPSGTTGERAARRWSGSTCCSPPARCDRLTARENGRRARPGSVAAPVGICSLCREGRLRRDWKQCLGNGLGGEQADPERPFRTGAAYLSSKRSWGVERRVGRFAFVARRYSDCLLPRGCRVGSSRDSRGSPTGMRRPFCAGNPSGNLW